MALGPLESIISLQHQNTQSMHPLLLASSYLSPPPASHHLSLQFILPLILHPLYPHQLSLENYKPYALAKSSTSPCPLSPSPFPIPLPSPPLPASISPLCPSTPPKRSNPGGKERETQHTQRRPRRNRSHSPLPIAQLRGDRQLPLIANAHIEETLVPSVSASAPWPLFPHPPSSPPRPLSSSPPPPSSSHPPLLQPLHPSHAKEWTNKPLNNHPLPNLKRQRLSPVVTSIELAPITCQSTFVMYLHGITALGLTRAGVC